MMVMMDSTVLLCVIVDDVLMCWLFGIFVFLDPRSLVESVEFRYVRSSRPAAREEEEEGFTPKVIFHKKLYYPAIRCSS